MQACFANMRFAAIALVLLLAACASYDNPYFVHSVWRNAQASSADVNIFYLTDRAADKNAPGGFGYVRGSDASCGTLDALVPAARLPAGDAEFAKTVARKGLSCSNGKTSLGALADAITQAAAPCRSVLIFVHGYYTGFETAALRTAQLKHDAQFGCAAVAFSWSSTGTISGATYEQDLQVSEQAEPLLSDLVRDLAARGLRIHIVAHSMGTRLVLKSLAALVHRNGMLRENTIGEVLLFAGDISADPQDDEFLRLADIVRPQAQRMTIYAASDDAALAVARTLHGGARRLGREPQGDLRYRAAGPHAIDVIDASGAPGDLVGHDYYGLSFEVVSDMALTLAGVSTADRAAGNAGRKPTLVCEKNCDGDPVYALNVSANRRPNILWRIVRWLAPLVPIFE
ncbi:MAG: alpha/beta fold hydrolase [Proteobacteria bacterium]|nr:alpha/beta fold hydrolase [Pseudomonadota bacterium]